MILTAFRYSAHLLKCILKVENKNALVRPIAGTRRRGKNQEEDEYLEKDLLADEKESAEHLMLVDLARNDLGRVCKAGSVHVTDSRSIEKYKNVIHIVSEVQGDLKDDCDCLDALKSTFPAGTVSGAPKIRAISVIDRLEEEKRGFMQELSDTWNREEALIPALQ